MISPRSKPTSAPPVSVIKPKSKIGFIQTFSIRRIVGRIRNGTPNQWIAYRIAIKTHLCDELQTVPINRWIPYRISSRISQLCTSNQWMPYRNNPTKQSPNQPITQSNNQSNAPIIKSTNHQISQSTNQQINPISQSSNPPINQSIKSENQQINR